MAGRLLNSLPPKIVEMSKKRVILNEYNSKCGLCGRCGGECIYYKVMGWDKQPIYMYMVRCPKCFSYSVPRTKKYYDIVKDIHWRISKKYKEMTK